MWFLKACQASIADDHLKRCNCTFMLLKWVTSYFEVQWGLVFEIQIHII